MDICPICQQGPPLKSEPVQGRDAVQIGCSRCGEYQVDGLAALSIEGYTFDERCYISAVTRGASDAGRQLEITNSEGIKRLIESAPKWHSPFEGVDRLLLLMASRAKGWVAPTEVNKEVDYPLICARGPNEVNGLMHIAWSLGLLVQGKPVISVEGWRRIDELRKQLPDSRQAFVAMWFDKQLDDVWTSGIKPGIEDSGYFRAIRVDAVEHNDKIDDRIIAEIRRSGLLVADFTGNRGGVYFEAGYARGMGIPVIWTCRADSLEGVHFDTRQFNHIVWNTPDEIRAKLNDRIAATVLPRNWRPT